MHTLKKVALILAINFLLIGNCLNLKAEKSNPDPKKKYVYKFEQTIKIPKWAMWFIGDSVFTHQWEGSTPPYCSGVANGCFGIVITKITSQGIIIDTIGNPIEPSFTDPDSTVIFGDDYIAGIDSGARIALIKLDNNIQGMYGDIFDIPNTTIIPEDSTQNNNPLALTRNIAVPILFPAQRAKYSPFFDAFVAYFYDLDSN